MTQPIQASPFEYAEAQPALTWTAATPLAEAMKARVAPKSEAVAAVVNHGRWIVQCPDCNGAQLGCITDHRFMCNECANIAIDGLWRPVVWPEHVKDLSEVLAKRKDRAMQNWEVGESVDDLRNQNAVLKATEAAGGDWSQHLHSWPERLKGDSQTCSGCGLMLPTALVREARRTDT